MGRLELLHWLNRTLRSDYASIQQCGDCVAYCQILDGAHPSREDARERERGGGGGGGGVVGLHRLDYNARYVGDNARNAKVLMHAMRGLQLECDVDYESVASGNFTVRGERRERECKRERERERERSRERSVRVTDGELCECV